ncbi:MAG: carboxylesterase family protein [Flavobacteriales bacterium]|nr:carboxylesterase family protein [Flavobacteriales bacterium]
MRILLSLVLLLTHQGLSSQNCNSVRYLDEVFDGVDVLSGVQFAAADPYGVIGSQDLLLDLYMPTGDLLEKRPLIIYTFGGGFLIGTRFQPPVPQFCEHFARLGYVVASIDYRIGFNTASSESAERAVYRGVQDVRAAMRYLGQFSEGYGIDTTTIFLTGTSAGCFSALHSTFMEEGDRPASSYGILLEPADMGCANCSGNNYIDNRELRPKGIINNWGAMLDTIYIDPIAKDNVPVISFHGTDDLIVPYNTGSPFSYPVFPAVQGSAPIHQRLDHLGIMNQLVPLVGIGHEPWLTDATLLDTVYRYSTPFLYEIMRPHTSAIVGDDSVPQGETRTYSVTGQPGSQFCWTVSGGTIIADNGSSIDVLWNATGIWAMSVVEVSSIEVLGNEQTMEVEVVQPTAVPTMENGTSVLFPNPVSSMLHVSWNTTPSTGTLQLFDTQGRLLRTIPVADGQEGVVIDVTDIPNGIYVLRTAEANMRFAKTAY